MKKVLIILLVLVFAGAVLSRNAWAMETEEIVSVDYDLPFPGMLPDSPFYIIKDTRDKVVGLLVMGPVNKSFYELLLSDKKLWAGRILMTSGNEALGTQTLLLGEEYFAGAVREAAKAKKQGMNVSELLAKLLVSSSKHAEELDNALNSVSDENSDAVLDAMSLNEKSRSQVIELSL